MKILDAMNKKIMAGLLLASLALPMGQSIYAANAFDDVRGQGVVQIIDGEHFLITDEGQKLVIHDKFSYNPDEGNISIGGYEELEDGDHIVYGRNETKGFGGWFGNHYKKLIF